MERPSPIHYGERFGLIDRGGQGKIRNAQRSDTPKQFRVKTESAENTSTAGTCGDVIVEASPRIRLPSVGRSGSAGEQYHVGCYVAWR